MPRTPASSRKKRANPPSDAALWTVRDEFLMRECLALAREALGLTSPNPAVGCVIVRNGKIVGRGITGVGGRPHAEAEALCAAGARARGATVYVSFEPCAHQGKTPPCAAALVQAGVSRVVAGCLDPYPPVRGRGLAILKRAGIETVVGVLAAECRELNEGFITRVTRGRPFVVLKLATSLDGRIAAQNGDARWVSSEQSRLLVHQWRRESDVVMVGAGTVIADNPRLTCRIEGGRDPVRVIIDGHLRSPHDAVVFHLRSPAPTILVTAAHNLDTARHNYPGVEVLTVSGREGVLRLDELMCEFARRGWSKVLLEGGAHLAASALDAGVVDRVAFFLAPRIIGTGLAAVEGLSSATVRDALRLGPMHARMVGEDWLIEAPVNHRRSGA
ncbi:MAG: bifunctional diaminohydroxyphosphoribosylaminopyrimidine deaminase/5-amino-6-(5-phosphoribosylamino)uracil reductase RibD [Candidatus Binataceae bacterium]